MPLYYESYRVQTYTYSWDRLTAVVPLCVKSLDRGHCHYFHSVDVDFSSHLARNIMLSNFTCFDRGSECFVESLLLLLIDFNCQFGDLMICHTQLLSSLLCGFHSMKFLMVQFMNNFLGRSFLSPDP